VSRLDDKEALLIFSVGGGDEERKISVNLIRAIELARQRAARVFGIVGRSIGYTARNGDVVGHSAGRTRLGDAAHRGYASGRLALPGLPSGAANSRNQMVSDHAAVRAVFLDRDGVLTVPEFRDGGSFRAMAAGRLSP